MTDSPNRKNLSKLQKHILSFGKNKGPIGYADILQSYYKLAADKGRNGGKWFRLSPDQRRQIMASRVSVCKSVNRLERRGLLRRVHEPGYYYSFEVVGSTANIPTHKRK